jgi:macrolide transport system ATP-binding/permease protein
MSDDSQRVLIRAAGLQRVFAGDVATVALRDATLTVRSGEFIAIIGPSGSGKSTLLNVLGLLDKPTDGTYEIDGLQSETLSERQRDRLRSETIGFVFQSSYVLPHEPAILNAALGLRIQGTPVQTRTKTVAAVLNQFGLSTRANVQARFLSGGERQRLAIARAMATEPKILLADEPTGNLDSENTTTVINDLRGMANRGVAVVVITHDDEVAAAADRQLSVVDGVLTEDSSAAHPAALATEFPGERQSGVRHRRPYSWPHQIMETLADGLNGLSSRPLRTGLLLLAFLLGSGGLVAATGLTQTTSAQVADRLNIAALDEVRFADTRSPAGIVPNTSERRSVQEAVGRLEGVMAVGLSAVISPSDAKISRFNAGEAFYTGPVELADASQLDILDILDNTLRPPTVVGNMSAFPDQPAAVIGTTAAKTLGIANPSPGVIIWVGPNPVPVIGFVESSGRDDAATDKVFINPAAAAGVRNLQPTYVVRTKPGYPAPLSDAIPHALSPDNPGSISVQTVADLRNLKKGVSGELGLMIGLVSSVLLILACLTAATAMYLSVQARAGEVALRRALGASRWSIASMFLTEGTLVGLAGGLAGSILGTFAVVMVSVTNGWSPVLTPFMPLIGAITGALTGSLSAVYPASVAARSDPALALRS